MELITMNNPKAKSNSGISLDEAYDLFDKFNQTKNLADCSIKTYYDNYSSYFCEFLDYLRNVDDEKERKDITRLAQINSEVIQDYTLFMKQKKSIRDITINTRLRHIRAFFYYCMEENMLLPFKIHLMRIQKTAKDTYTDTEIDMLLKKPDLSTVNFITYRNWVITVFFYETGVRLSTLSNVLIKDLLFNRDKIFIRVQKNKKISYIDMSIDLKNILTEYLTYRKRRARPLFVLQSEWRAVKAWRGTGGHKKL